MSSNMHKVTRDLLNFWLNRFEVCTEVPVNQILFRVSDWQRLCIYFYINKWNYLKVMRDCFEEKGKKKYQIAHDLCCDLCSFGFSLT